MTLMVGIALLLEILTGTELIYTGNRPRDLTRYRAYNHSWGLTLGPNPNPNPNPDPDPNPNPNPRYCAAHHIEGIKLNEENWMSQAQGEPNTNPQNPQNPTVTLNTVNLHTSTLKTLKPSNLNLNPYRNPIGDMFLELLAALIWS